MAGPAPAASPAKLASPSTAQPSGSSPGTSPPANMNRAVVNVAARRQELLDKEVSATSWKVRWCKPQHRHTALHLASKLAVNLIVQL